MLHSTVINIYITFRIIIYYYIGTSIKTYNIIIKLLKNLKKCIMYAFHFNVSLSKS